MKKQVNNEHYTFNKYVSQSRWISYYHQINYTIASQPKNILIIGAGDNIVGSVLKSFGYNVTTFDFAKDLKPDIVGDVTKIDEILDKKYDVVICCQVLEHIPFEKFEKTIKKMKNVTNNKLILSLPYNSTYIKFGFRLLGFKELNLVKRIPIFWQKQFRFEVEGNNEHYWEVGVPNISKKRILSILNEYFELEKDFYDKNNLYHQFFICKVKK